MLRRDLWQKVFSSHCFESSLKSQSSALFCIIASLKCLKLEQSLMKAVLITVFVLVCTQQRIFNEVNGCFYCASNVVNCIKSFDSKQQSAEYKLLLKVELSLATKFPSSRCIKQRRKEVSRNPSESWLEKVSLNLSVYDRLQMERAQRQMKQRFECNVMLWKRTWWNKRKKLETSKSSCR